MEGKKNSKVLSFLSHEIFKISIIYILLIFGAILQVLEMFEEITRPMAGPVIIMLTLVAFWEIFRKYKLPQPNKQGIIDQPNLRNRYVVYFALVVVSSWIIEFVGVKTGWIFGHYYYHGILKPTFQQVPIAIAFVWFLALVTSHAMLQRVSRVNLNNIPIFIKSIIIGATMMFFDFLMEPAAIRLYYWTWQNEVIPLQNYFAWFVLGTFYAFIGFKMRVLKIVFPNIIYHMFLAMSIYFVILQLA